MTDVIPLPDHLSTCGCPRAQQGRHINTCVPAREYDNDRDRYKNYPDGTRFRTVMWDLPFRISARIDINIEIDPVAFIAEHRKQYDAFDLEAGYEDWEKPMVFLCSLMEEDLGGFGGWFGHPHHVSRVDVNMDDFNEHPRWTPEDTERIPPPLPPVDPNQGDLFDV